MRMRKINHDRRGDGGAYAQEIHEALYDDKSYAPSFFTGNLPIGPDLDKDEGPIRREARHERVAVNLTFEGVRDGRMCFTTLYSESVLRDSPSEEERVNGLFRSYKFGAEYFGPHNAAESAKRENVFPKKSFSELDEIPRRTCWSGSCSRRAGRPLAWRRGEAKSALRYGGRGRERLDPGMTSASPEPTKPESAKSDPVAAKATADAEAASKVGTFILKYHTFVSSVLIGVAGLIATSIWQYRQSETTRNQAIAQQKVAETAADNSWKITRADILSKNLAILSSSGPDTASQRYGVLLSLTRSEIIDPELAVSYALELGKDNADDMLSVLANTKHKDYARLARAYALSCEERYGITRSLEVCSDRLAARSAALGKLFADDIRLALTAGEPGPMVLLGDERVVQAEIQQYVGLYKTVLTDMYEHREWDAILRFAAFSPGAHVVSALVLATARTGEFVTDDEAKQLDGFHDEQTKWLTGYFAGKQCDAECKGRLLEVMISHYVESQGDFDATLRALIASPRAASGVAISRLHARLLWCQIDESDLAPLRDHVLLPVADKLVGAPATDPVVRDALISLLAVVPPPLPAETEATATWTSFLARLDKAGPKVAKLLRDRRAAAARQRTAPPPALRARDFCAAPDTAPGPGE